MSAIRVAPGRHPMADLEQEQQHRVLQHMETLPQHLLELICSSRRDKQAWRQTCRQLRQQLDDNLICLKLRTGKDYETALLIKLLKRVQHVHGLKTIFLSGPHDYNSCQFISRMFQHLPSHITTLAINAEGDLDIKELKRLGSLTSLNLYIGYGKLAGLEHISGLTSLYTTTSAGSVAHLAPSLKLLTVSNCKTVPDMDQLTNLEMLEVRCQIPGDFFSKHSNLPLKHMFVYPYLPLKHMFVYPYWCQNFLYDVKAWRSAPKTLTHLTMQTTHAAMPPGILPTTITHLQLLHATDMQDKQVAEAAAALPWLRSLDLFLYEAEKDWSSAFGSLSKFTNLQILGICAHAGHGVYWQREQILSAMPEVAKAVERGVKLNVVASQRQFYGPFSNPFWLQSSWAAPG